MLHWPDFLVAFFIIALLGSALRKRVDIYDQFIMGASEGFSLTFSILPHLMAMMVAIAWLKASGFFTLLLTPLSPLLHAIHFPAPLLPLALIRPFSGQGANAILAQLAHTYGGDHPIARTACIMVGSTETTFYVLFLYFGSQGIRHTRYAIPVALGAELVGITASALIGNCWF